MQTVASIEPMCGKPGLVAFLCSACGSTSSVLVYPEHREMDRLEGNQIEGVAR